MRGGSPPETPYRAAILTGYTSTNGLSEAEQMKAAWDEHVTPALLEVAGRSTAENASRSLPLILALGDVRRVVVVTSAWHLRTPFFFAVYRDFGLHVALPRLVRARALAAHDARGVPRRSPDAHAARRGHGHGTPCIVRSPLRVSGIGRCGLVTLAGAARLGSHDESPRSASLPRHAIVHTASSA